MQLCETKTRRLAPFGKTLRTSRRAQQAAPLRVDAKGKGTQAEACATQGRPAASDGRTTETRRFARPRQDTQDKAAGAASSAPTSAIRKAKAQGLKPVACKAGHRRQV